MTVICGHSGFIMVTGRLAEPFVKGSHTVRRVFPDQDLSDHYLGLGPSLATHLNCQSTLEGILTCPPTIDMLNRCKSPVALVVDCEFANFARMSIA